VFRDEIFLQAACRRFDCSQTLFALAELAALALLPVHIYHYLQPISSKIGEPQNVAWAALKSSQH
jgi:hypothetical protein